MNCDEINCQILVDPPEAPSVPQPQPRPAAPAPAPTTTTPAPVEPVERVERVDTQGSEKGPSSPDLGYYASHLTSVNSNSEKGPSDAMPYMPEQYQYLQAQVGSPGLRGPPGIAKSK